MKQWIWCCSAGRSPHTWKPFTGAKLAAMDVAPLPMRVENGWWRDDKIIVRNTTIPASREFCAESESNKAEIETKTD